jgi:serine/threonine protein kinase
MAALSTYRHPMIIRVVHTFKERDGTREHYREHEYDHVYVVLEKAPDVAPGPLLATFDDRDRRRLWIDESGPSELYFYYITRPFLSERQVALITYQILSGVAYLHSRNVIHRDLKPENVFLVATPEGGTRPKILDFGIARVEWAETRITVNGVPMGTPGYMAPEQERGGDVDSRADIFAFGAMLYECLTGEAPAPLTASFHVRIGSGEGMAWENLRWPQTPEIAEPWRRLVERAMDLDPGERFQEARELLEALRAIPPEVTGEDPFALLAE